MSGAKERNDRLAAVIQRANCSHKGLARRVIAVAARHGVELNTSHQAVARWVAGVEPSDQTPLFIAEALAEKLGRPVSLADIGFSHLSAARASSALEYAPSANGAVDAVMGLARRDAREEEPDETGADLIAGPVMAWMLQRPDESLHGVAPTGRIGASDIAAVRTTAEAFMRLDFQFGGGHARSALVEYFRRDVEPMLRATFTEQIGRSLFGAAAELVQLMAWTAYDIGRNATAKGYLVQALRLAQAADDRMLGARMLAALSHQATFHGRYAEAEQLARAAQESAKGHATPTAMSLFTAMEARALAAQGDQRGSARAMRDAEKHLGISRAENDPAWLHYFDDAELAAEFGHGFRDLGQFAEARTFIERALEITEPVYARSLAFCRMCLASVQFQAGELPAALDTATQALTLAGNLRSARYLRYVTDFQADIARYGDDPSVIAFNQAVQQVRLNAAW
jgi:tetratricopeptide (TPR) repeat protein